MGNGVIGQRLRALRKELELSAHDAAKILGFKYSHSLISIENGTKRVTAQELLHIAKKFEKSIYYFTDSFRLDGECRCSWRRTGVSSEELLSYERRANEWIAAYRALAKQVGHEMRLMRPSLGLTRDSSFEESRDSGERFVQRFDLGEVPALKLGRIMEQKLGILVLFVNAPRGISGAAYRLRDLDVVLLARDEPVVRRHFTLAHELFHILTWEAMPPQHSEQVSLTGRDRVEQLANKFSETLLMPSSVLDRFGSYVSAEDDELLLKLTEGARRFQVSAEALMWRLVHANRLPETRAIEILDAVKFNNEPKIVERSSPPLFSKSFATVLNLGLSQGCISVRRAAKLLEIEIDAMPDFFASHGIDYVVEL